MEWCWGRSAQPQPQPQLYQGGSSLGGIKSQSAAWSTNCIRIARKRAAVPSPDTSWIIAAFTPINTTVLGSTCFRLKGDLHRCPLLELRGILVGTKKNNNKKCCREKHPWSNPHQLQGNNSPTVFFSCSGREEKEVPPAPESDPTQGWGQIERRGCFEWRRLQRGTRQRLAGVRHQGLQRLRKRL